MSRRPPRRRSTCTSRTMGRGAGRSSRQDLRALSRPKRGHRTRPGVCGAWRGNDGALTLDGPGAARVHLSSARRRRERAEAHLVADDDPGMAGRCAHPAPPRLAPTEVTAARKRCKRLPGSATPPCDGRRMRHMARRLPAIREAHRDAVILMTAYAARICSPRRTRRRPADCRNRCRGHALQPAREDRGPRPQVWSSTTTAFLETLQTVLEAAAATSVGRCDRPGRRAPDGTAADVVVLDSPSTAAAARSVLAIRRANPAVVLILCSGHTRLMDDTLSTLPPGWVFAGLIKPFPPRRLLDLLEAVNGT